MKKLFLIFLMLLFFVGCSPSAAQIQAAIEETNTARQLETDIQTDLPTEKSTVIPQATVTPTSTNTPKPTNTDKPSITPTSQPDPIIIEGSGDDVVQIDKWEGSAIVDIANYSSGYFGVKSYDEDGEHLELLANTIGRYEGKVTMDLLTYGETNASFLEIEAEGDWSISIYPISFEYLNHTTAPGYYEGESADVILVDGDSQTATFTASDGYFGVKGLSSDGINLLVNEIAPYEGKVMLPQGLVTIIVDAESNWSVEFH